MSNEALEEFNRIVAGVVLVIEDRTREATKDEADEK
jgi:hypothetical protein